MTFTKDWSCNDWRVSQKPSQTYRLNSSSELNKNRGFTLIELLLAAALGSGFVLVAGNALLSQMQSSTLAETLQRKRDDSNRATSFIESEIAMSERVLAPSSDLTVPTNCASYGVTKENTKLILDIDRQLPLILYAVVNRSTLNNNEQTQWIGNYLLVRCGPDIGTGSKTYSATSGININTSDSSYDDYRSGPSVASVLIDGLAANSCGSSENGFCVTFNSTKAVSFILALDAANKNVSSPFRLEASNHSRINPAAAYPEYLSICDRMCPTGNCSEINNIYVNQGTVGAEAIDLSALTRNVIICGRGGGDTLKAGMGIRNVIDGGKDSILGATITGGSGITCTPTLTTPCPPLSTIKAANYLFGTKGNDTITAASNHVNTLVGRCGNDELIGGNGTNHYLPWDQACFLGNESTTITGGSGTDIIYLRGLRSDFAVSNCSLSSCTISKNGASMTVSNAEVFIFNDQRLDLR